jgi:hypothetical protein
MTRDKRTRKIFAVTTLKMRVLHWNTTTFHVVAVVRHPSKMTTAFILAGTAIRPHEMHTCGLREILSHPRV